MTARGSSGLRRPTCPALTPGIGHTGHLPGYFTDMFYMLKDDTVVVQLGNSDEGRNFTGVLLVALYQ